MPKDPTRNVDRYKVRGGQFDDLDRTKNEGGLTEDETPLTGGREETNFIPGESPQDAAERRQSLIGEVHAQAERRRSATRSAARKSAGGGGGKGGAKKSAKSAAKSAKKAASASKGAAKKSRGAGGAKKPAAGRKGAGGRGPSGGARKTQQKRAGKKVGSSAGGGRLSGPGAG
jgi:hypothetical protein